MASKAQHSGVLPLSTFLPSRLTSGDPLSPSQKWASSMYLSPVRPGDCGSPKPPMMPGQMHQVSFQEATKSSYSAPAPRTDISTAQGTYHGDPGQTCFST